MQFNGPVTIEQVANGFVIRPFREAADKLVTRDNTVIKATLADVLAWVERNFRTSVCPKCGKVAPRETHWLFQCGVGCVRCPGCKLIAIDGVEMDWLDYSHNEQYESMGQVTDQLPEIARQKKLDR